MEKALWREGLALTQELAAAHRSRDRHMIEVVGVKILGLEVRAAAWDRLRRDLGL